MTSDRRHDSGDEPGGEAGGASLEGVLLDGRYRLHECIARGGMASVYRGTHVLMKREVAVKVLENRRLGTPGQVEGFKEEINRVSELEHPHIVMVYDAGYDPAVGHYAAMRMLRGKDLAARIVQGPPLSILGILDVARQASLGLAAIHEKGIIHRDVKPENIFLVDETHAACGFSVRLLDFGVSMALANIAAARRGDRQSVAGTPYTMSPEQIRGHSLDARTDIYSYGIVLFELLTGRYPFRPESVSDLLRMQVLVPPPRASSMAGGEWIPAKADELLDAMLAKDRDRRPESMREVRRRLESLKPALTSAWARHFMGRDRKTARSQLTGRKANRFRTLQLINTEALLTSGDVPPALPDRRRRRARSPVTARTTAARGGGAGHAAEPFRVAVVDDEPAIRMLLQMVCERAGCRHESFECGEDVLAGYEQGQRFDAVILDLLMPGIDGLETLQKLREAGYSGPVIVCSTLEAAEVRRRVSDFEDVVFMDKVIDFNRMRDLLGHWASIRDRAVS